MISRILRPVLFGLAVMGSAGAVQPPAREAVTFSQHIAPIIFDNCSVCHRPGTAAPFALLSYRDVFKRGRLIAEVTRTGYMPPWPAGPGWGEFKGERILDQGEIELIERWVAGGMPPGDPELQPEPPRFTGAWPWGQPDLVLEIEEPYAIPADGPDIYRNFAIDLNLSEDRWVRAIAFQPTARSVAHHALFFFDATGESRRLQGDDPTPGFSPMTGAVFAGLAANLGRRSSQPLAGWLGSWAVGREGWQVPDGFGSRLLAGSDLVVQVHFHPSGRSESEQGRIGLYFEKKPARSFARIQVPPFFGVFARIDIPAGVTDYRVTDSFVFPVDVMAFAASAHAHYLAREMKMKAILPDGREQRLLWIPDWDLSWQDQYQYREMVFLPRGTRLDVSISYDNSVGNPDNPSHPPRRVTWGPDATDEMGSLSLWVFAVDESEAPRLQEFRRRVSQRALVRRALEEPQAWEGIPAGVREKFDIDGNRWLSDEEKAAVLKHFDDRLSRFYRAPDGSRR